MNQKPILRPNKNKFLNRRSANIALGQAYEKAVEKRFNFVLIEPIDLASQALWNDFQYFETSSHFHCLFF